MDLVVDLVRRTFAIEAAVPYADERALFADVACLLPAVREPFRQARRGSAGGTPKAGHILTSPDVCIL